MTNKRKTYRKEDIDIYTIPIESFFHFAFSIDPVVFGYDNDELKIMLIERGVEPMIGKWALPGDLVRPEEDIDDSANAILRRLTGIDNVFLKQVQTFGKVDRHPLGRVVTVAYYALVDLTKINVAAASWASSAKWWKLSELPPLAFDHDIIIKACQEHLKNDAKFHPIGFELLPEKFTLAHFQRLYEAIFETSLDKSNFRKKVKSLNILEELEELETGVSHRPAKLYRFDKNRYDELLKAGFYFDLGL